jgi:hypothetical protein
MGALNFVMPKDSTMTDIANGCAPASQQPERIQTKNLFL